MKFISKTPPNFSPKSQSKMKPLPGWYEDELSVCEALKNSSDEH